MRLFDHKCGTFTSMSSDLKVVIDRRIAEMERQLAALRSARAILLGQPGGSPGRRTFTEAQRRAISKRMKAAWASRKANK